MLKVLVVTLFYQKKQIEFHENIFLYIFLSFEESEEYK